MKTIYCLSGLGADQRVFQKLNIPGVRLVPIHWADFDKHDGIPCYAQKLATQITEENPTLIGLSFGGMIASEIAKIRPCKQVFLISSAKDATEFPPLGGFVKFIGHHGLLPISIVKIPSKQIYERFGAVTDEEKKLLMDILRNTENAFAKWSIKAIIDWQSTTHTDNIIHIHGTEDKMILPRYVKPTHWVAGGTHFMVYHQAAEVSKLIAQHLHTD